ncbi:MAG: alpha/beta hydrolase [Xanthomonadales bacterium]|nr:alpha/beta hydrolase [Xanthomonadales bacterium]
MPSIVVVLFVSLLAVSTDLRAAPAGEESITFAAQGGESVAALQGQLQVPSHWSRPNGPKLSLSYVRFPATGDRKGSPIVYLAGGPGGSGIETARGRRFPLFMALREFGDVIAFDQRGTGASSPQPTCSSSQVIDDAVAYSDAEFVELHRTAAHECLAQWQQAGIDLRDWTTAQSVRDLDALRLQLGAEKISLWGISYGSHLALAALASMDDRIDKVVLASVEGLAQTVKSPAQTDAYFERLQQAINTQPELAAQLPDLVGLMRRVHAKLEAEPIMLQISPPAGEPYEFLLERRDMQEFASMMIADPGNALQLLQLYAAVDAGVLEPVAAVVGRFHRPGQPIRYNPMPFAMDIASGISRSARQSFERESKAALLGGYLNFPMPQLADLIPELDLGEDFRRGPRSEVPVLVLSGTLDGRTYPDSQRQAVAGLSNVQITVVENAGHNLFMSSPAVAERIAAFLRGESGADRIVLEQWAR